jgi:hypothetical protein
MSHSGSIICFVSHTFESSPGSRYRDRGAPQQTHAAGITCIAAPNKYVRRLSWPKHTPATSLGAPLRSDRKPLQLTLPSS